MRATDADVVVEARAAVYSWFCMLFRTVIAYSMFSASYKCVMGQYCWDGVFEARTYGDGGDFVTISGCVYRYCMRVQVILIQGFARQWAVFCCMVRLGLGRRILSKYVVLVVVLRVGDSICCTRHNHYFDGWCIFCRKICWRRENVRLLFVPLCDF